MAENAYLHTGDVLSRRSRGGHTFKLCTIFSHTLELLLAFPYDWENETILPGALRHFKRYQTCMVTFLYTLHCMSFQWILGHEERGGDVEIVSTGCRPPSVPRPGRCRYICKRQLCGFTGWALCLLEGEPRYPGCYCYICKRQFLWIHRLGICPLGGGGQTGWHRAYRFMWRLF